MVAVGSSVAISERSDLCRRAFPRARRLQAAIAAYDGGAAAAASLKPAASAHG